MRDMVAAKASKLPGALAKALINDAEQVFGTAPKSLDDFIQAGRAITEGLPSGASHQGAIDCHAALLLILQKEVGVNGACQVASVGNGAKLVREASQRYPDSWTQKADAMGPLYARSAAGTRGYHYSTLVELPVAKLPGFKERLNAAAGTGWIEVRDGSINNAVHEYAHRLQAAMPELDRMFQDLHRRRTDGDALERLRDLLPVDGYAATELARKDGYRHPYQGKEYAHVPSQPALEVMTMAFEDVLGLSLADGRTASNFSSVYVKDREMFDFVVGLLRWWKP